jgi:TRAP-type C4-dicarboxylate transport system substrate-binding protein
VYGALQKGIVQGVLMPLDGLRAWRFAELTKYTTIAPYMTTTLFAVVMNANRWQSLPTEIKKAFEEVSESWLAKSGAVADDENLQALEWATKRHDHEVIVLPPNEVARWMARLQPEQDKYVSTMTAKGLPGKTTLDLALRLAERYNKQFPASQLPAR